MIDIDSDQLSQNINIVNSVKNCKRTKLNCVVTSDVKKYKISLYIIPSDSLYDI